MGKNVLSACSNIINILKGALDKYNIYLFISDSIEDIEFSQYQNFQLILPMRFHFMRYFVNSIIFRVSHIHDIGYCIVYLLKSTLKKRKCYKYSYFFKSESIWNIKLRTQSLPMQTLLMV